MPPNLQSGLKSLLESSTASKVCACLLESLKAASPEQLKELSALLAPLAIDSQTPKHCVRCHATFFDNQNDSTACKIEHGDNGDMELTDQLTDTYWFILDCCGEGYEAETDQPESQWCIEESHTTDPANVAYYDDDDEDKEDGKNPNVLTCTEKGCSKNMKRKRATKDTAKISKKRK